MTSCSSGDGHSAADIQPPCPRGDPYMIPAEGAARTTVPMPISSRPDGSETAPPWHGSGEQEVVAGLGHPGLDAVEGPAVALAQHQGEPDVGNRREALRTGSFGSTDSRAFSFPSSGTTVRAPRRADDVPPRAARRSGSATAPVTNAWRMSSQFSRIARVIRAHTAATSRGHATRPPADDVRDACLGVDQVLQPGHDGLLRADAVVDRLGRHTGVLGNVSHAGPRVAALSEEAAGRPEDLVARQLRLAVADLGLFAGMDPSYHLTIVQYLLCSSHLITVPVERSTKHDHRRQLDRPRHDPMPLPETGPATSASGRGIGGLDLRDRGLRPEPVARRLDARDRRAGRPILSHFSAHAAIPFVLAHLRAGCSGDGRLPRGSDAPAGASARGPGPSPASLAR